MTAQVIERYAHPQKQYTAMVGSMQLLPNGDRFVGLGSTRQVSQHTQDGEVVYHAEIADGDAQLSGTHRAFSSDKWVGRPDDGPDVYSYSWACGWGKTSMYAS